MPPRRRATLLTLGSLYTRASKRLRATVAAGALVSTAAKLLPVLIAQRIAADDIRGATIVGVAGVVVMAGSRVLSSGVRVNAECDLHRAVARALLDGDVLVEPSAQPLRGLFEPLFHARTLMTETVPELTASALAALVVTPLLVATLSMRALVVSGIAVLVVVAALVALSRVTSALQRRVWQAQEKVLDRVGFAVEGRLELVARGAEAAAMRAIERSIDHYRSVARRGAWGAALLGRAPLAAGLGAVVVVVILDTSYRDAVTSAVLAKAIVLAACLPIVLGVVMRANEMMRLSAMVGPVLDVFAAPRRPELARRGATPPPMPATIVANDVTFSYHSAATPTLRGVSFQWEPGTALLLEGPNGSGKSTLIRLVLGLREVDAGSITVGGVDLPSLDLPALRRSIAYLPQRPYLGEAHSTVRSALCVVDADATEPTLTAALARVGLAEALTSRLVDALDVPVGELSAGQRQRVALARLLVQDAAVYLLDEPDANLDRAGIAMVGEVVAELVTRGRMVAIAAHTDELTSIEGTRVRLGS